MLVACRGCDACQPDLLPQDTGDSDSDAVDSDPVDSDPVDSDLPPPCDQPEIEPNGLDSPNPVVMERYACGDFDPVYDVDVRTFVVERPMWMLVRIDGRSIGRADPMFILSAADGTSAQASMRDDGYEDPLLIFPTEAAEYTLLVTEEAGQGGPAFYPYKLMIAEAKAPVSFDTTEPAEAHASRAQAAMLPIGTTLFGDMDGAAESDWYALDIPAGKQVLRTSIEAFSAGSAGDFALQVYDATGRLVEESQFGQYGWEHDPWLSVSSSGSEVVYLRVTEEGGRSGPAYWYTLHTTLEAE
jgi:hypothetical protein